MKSKKNMVLGLVAALGAMVVGTGTARAGAVLDFQLGGSGGGSISYAGGTAPLIGTNIPIGLVSGTDTPLNNGGSLLITGTCAGGRGCLNFQTGNMVSNVGGVLTFGAGTAFTITGGISSLGLGNSTILLTASSVQATVQNIGGFFSFTLPNGSDTKNPTLVSYFFATAPISWAFAGSISGPPVNLSGFTITNETSVDIGNAAVPEPMSVLLLGTTMVGVATIIRRRKKNSTKVG